MFSDGMSLTKIPFVLLAIWGIHISYRRPNPPPPQHERFPSSLRLPIENSRIFYWLPTIVRVSKYLKDILAENSLNDPRIGPTIRRLCCRDINYPGFCEPVIASIQTNIVKAHLERWQARKHSHVKHRCNRIDFNCIGNMDKADVLPSHGTIFPDGGQYTEGSRAYCLWSIFCRSSSKLHRLHFDV